MADCCCATELQPLQYWSVLHSFTADTPARLASGVVQAQQLVAHGAIAGARIALAATIALVTGAFSFIKSLVYYTLVSAAYGAPALVIYIAWQAYYPFRVTLQLLARLSCFRGIAFEFPPLDSSIKEDRYAVLTLNCEPDPYTTDTILALLAQHDAHATFFVTGSQVDKCDAIGVGNGHEELGKDILGRMLGEGHQLGVMGWQVCPTNQLSASQLFQGLTDCSRLLATVQRHHTQAAADTNSNSTSLSSSTKRYRWFRPQKCLPTPSMVETAEKLGYTTVLASVFPWDNCIKWPWLNALYVWSKVYTGAVIMLNDGSHLLPTLQYILPWLKESGYKLVTLDTAIAISTEGLGELTTDILAAHNQACTVEKSASYGAIDVIARAASSGSLVRQYGPGSASGSSPGKTPPHDGQDAMTDDEIERARVRAARRAEADKRAGIDRQLASMSAAEKRAADRRERERREAEKRRARRAAEEAKAQQRYAEHVRRKAEQHLAAQQDKAEAIHLWRQQSLGHTETHIDEIQPAEA